MKENSATTSKKSGRIDIQIAMQLAIGATFTMVPPMSLETFWFPSMVGELFCRYLGNAESTERLLKCCHLITELPRYAYPVDSGRHYR